VKELPLYVQLQRYSTGVFQRGLQYSWNNL